MSRIIITLAIAGLFATAGCRREESSPLYEPGGAYVSGETSGKPSAGVPEAAGTEVYVPAETTTPAATEVSIDEGPSDEAGVIDESAGDHVRNAAHDVAHGTSE